MASFGRNLEIYEAVREVNRRLGKVAALVEDRVKATMITQAGLIAAEIKSVAPVGTDADAGKLKQSVRVVEGMATKKKAFVVKIVAGGQGTIKDAYNYARAVEHGTQKMPAHPFFWPLWRLRRRGARLAVRRAAVKAVKDVWGDK